MAAATSLGGERAQGTGVGWRPGQSSPWRKASAASSGVPVCRARVGATKS